MHSPASFHPPAVPAELCGYAIDRTLTNDQSYLAGDSGGRRVVLKKVDEDCMLGSQLHPSIKERLSRVRELAHGGVANLHGVGREGDAAWLIWEYVEGQTFDQYLADDRHPRRDVLRVARELVLAVDSLHKQGIVHGAVTAGNVIVSADGVVRLIHVSPLLYADFEVDVDGVAELLKQAAERLGGHGAAIQELTLGPAGQRRSLRDLATRLATLLEVRVETAFPKAELEERHIRRRTWLAAGIVGLLGMVLAYGIWRVAQGGADLRAAPWVNPAPASDK